MIGFPKVIGLATPSGKLVAALDDGRIFILFVRGEPSPKTGLPLSTPVWEALPAVPFTAEAAREARGGSAIT